MDVSRSFLPNPSSPTKVEEFRSFSFKPVVRVANLTTTGSVIGYALSDLGTGILEDHEPLFEVSVMVYAGEDTNTAFTNSAGYYEVLGLYGGTWQILAEANGHMSGMTSVDVVPGNFAEADSLRLPLLPGAE
jgi:hypothetical protein